MHSTHPQIEELAAVAKLRCEAAINSDRQLAHHAQRHTWVNSFAMHGDEPPQPHRASRLPAPAIRPRADPAGCVTPPRSGRPRHDHKMQGHMDGQLQLDGPTPLVFDARPAIPTEALVDATWTLESLVNGDTVQSVRGQPATLLLLPDGTVDAGTGCRMLSGKWVQSGAEVLLPELAAVGDCPTDLAEQDGHVVSVLGDGFNAQVDGNVLTVTSMGDKGLVYRAGTADDSDRS
jgi:heat shock protein HslJ